jgi:hypothetical protein
MNAADFALLTAFRSLFEGTRYLHRDSSLGDRVAGYLFEDLYTLSKSAKLHQRIDAREHVLNVQNRTVGIPRRRGDGTFGELVPSSTAVSDSGYSVGRGPVATIEIGAETKILAKAMIKQIDRVIGDLVRQTEEFRKRGSGAICVGIVGVNHSEIYTSYEGERAFPTDGRKYKHPSQEAEDAISRLEPARFHFDEFVLLKFRATNLDPFPFSWVNEQSTVEQYSASLTRISRLYDRRFP